MQEANFKEQAFPLIMVDEKTNKYVLTQEAEQFLSAVPSPIGIVSVAGLYRTGKSYLLNRMLLNRGNGFGVGNTINACTKGLWCWGSPLKGKTPEGQPINIIVVDTEGIGALDEDQTHDTRIFTLAILASSCFIYNSVGSIDQNALQNLSLVVNLTKHIQIKSGHGTENDDIDPDQFAHYFPSFYWVVRDFSLQLLTPQGDPISSKEYLERALAPREGFSEDTEEKNRIRRLLSSFFRERECFTLIRPIVDEDKLQVLDNIDLEELRADFVTQVLNFRKKVTQRMKPKTLHNKRLNGEMYISMLKSYVTAINEGAVPNIQNAWNYMCEQQAGKLFQQASDLFEFKMKEVKMPVNEEQYERESDAAMGAALQCYRQKMIGDDVPTIRSELLQKLKDRISTLRKQNQRLSKAKVQEYIKSLVYPTINEKAQKLIQSGGTFTQCNAQLDTFYLNFQKDGPNVANKKLYYLEAVRKFPVSMAQGFINREERMLKKMKEAKETQIEALRQQTQRKESDFNEKESSAQQTIRQLDKQKVQLTVKLESMGEQLKRLQSEKQKEEESLGKNLETKKRQLDKVKKNLEQKLEQTTFNYNEMSKSLISKEKQWEKDRAVFELKIQQYQKRVHESQKKETAISSNFNKENKELSEKLKQCTVMYQGQMSILKGKLQSSRIDKEDLEARFNELTEELKMENENLRSLEKKYKQELHEKTKELDGYKREYELEKMKLENDYSVAREGVDREYRQLEENIKKHEQTIKNLNDASRTQKASFQKDRAQLEQQIEFGRDEIKNLRQSLEDSKKTYQNTISTLEEAHGRANEEVENQIIADLKNSHLQGVKDMETEFQSYKRKMEYEIANLKKETDKLQLELKVQKTSRQTEQQETSTYIEKLKQDNQNIKERCSALDREKNTKVKEKESEFQKKVREMEEQIQEIKEREANEKNQRHNKAEENFTQLRNHFELQKERLEGKIIQEKTKHDRKMKELIEEYEEKLRIQCEQSEELRQSLIEEKTMNEEQLKCTVERIQSECDAYRKDLDHIKKQFQETKENAARKEFQLQEKYNSLMQNSRADRDNYFQKIENLQSELNKREKQLTSLTHEHNSLSMTLKRKESSIDQLSAEVSILKENSTRVIQELKNSKKELEQELVEKKMTYQKELALAKHSDQHSKTQIEKLQSKLKTITDEFDEKIKTNKEEAVRDFNIIRERLTNEKEIIEEKYEKLKRLSRENESNFKREATDLGKEIAVKNERITHLEEKIRQIEQKGTFQMRKLQEDVQKLRQNSVAEKRDLTKEIGEMRVQLTTYENKNKDLQMQYDKDTTLLENKVSHLEKTREDQKSDYMSQIASLKQTVESLQRDKLNQKSTTETVFNERINKMDRDHRAQLVKQAELYKKELHQLKLESQKNEMEVKSLKEMVAMTKSEKDQGIVFRDRKIEQLIEADKKKTSELESLKQSLDSRISEMQRSYDKEREEQKVRMNRIQQQSREKDGRISSMMFQNEKVRNRLTTEKDNFNDQMTQVKQKLQRRDKELMRLREQNTKLKADRKNKAHSFLANNTTKQWSNTTMMEDKKERFTSPKVEDENKENVMGFE